MIRTAEMCCYRLLEASVFDIVTMSIRTDVKAFLDAYFSCPLPTDRIPHMHFAGMFRAQFVAWPLFFPLATRLHIMFLKL